MALLSWSGEYSVGVQALDNEHMKLVDLVNQLHDGMKTGKAKAILGNILDELVNYTTFHFSHEEELFDKYEYPESGNHKHQHNELVLQVLEYKDNIENGKAVLSMDIMNFLKGWLINHIVKSDKSYSAFLNSKGIA